MRNWECGTGTHGAWRIGQRELRVEVGMGKAEKIREWEVGKLGGERMAHRA